MSFIKGPRIQDEFTHLEGTVSRQRIWQKRQNAKGLCQLCANPLAEHSNALCQHHLNAARTQGHYKRGILKAKGLYQQRKRSGICCQCGAVPSVKGRIYCEVCSTYHHDMYHIRLMEFWAALVSLLQLKYR